MKKPTPNYNKLIGAIAFVSGTSIGAAMLALPIITGPLGFIPSLIVLFIIWASLFHSAFLFVEISLWMPKEVNFLSMTKKLLGFWGHSVSWVCFLFLLYSLTTAYIAGLSGLLQSIIVPSVLTFVPQWLLCLLPILAFGVLLSKGLWFIDRVNLFFLSFLLANLFYLIFSLIGQVEKVNLSVSHWEHLPMSTSVILTSFGFHIIIPSLANYLNGNPNDLKLSIAVGSCIPLVVYGIWLFSILGTVPLEGEWGLKQGLIHNKPISSLIGYNVVLKAPMATKFAASGFSIAAILTSFFGVALSLYESVKSSIKDFFDSKDNMAQKTPIFAFCLTFFPTWVFSSLGPGVFISGLNWAGAAGVVTLLIVLPSIMVWIGRYHRKIESTFSAPGGKKALILQFILSIILLAMELFCKTPLS